MRRPARLKFRQLQTGIYRGIQSSLPQGTRLHASENLTIRKRYEFSYACAQRRARADGRLQEISLQSTSRHISSTRWTIQKRPGTGTAQCFYNLRQLKRSDSAIQRQN